MVKSRGVRDLALHNIQRMFGYLFWGGMAISKDLGTVPSNDREVK